MAEIIRTSSENADFIALVQKLDADLTARNGSEQEFYNQFNKIAPIKYVVVVYKDHLPIACGAIKAFDHQTMEVKRMFVEPAYRGKGLAALVLSELEKWTAELSYIRCVLETGAQMHPAIALYQKNHYHRIPNYGQYAGVENSVCFEKIL